MKLSTIYRTENTQRYFKDISSSKYDPIEEDDDVRKMFRDREQHRDIIINAHIRLVATIAKEYDANDKFMDYNQEGIEGLLEAFEKYDPDSNAKFSTYASYWIKAKMSMLCKDFNLVQRSNQAKIGSKAQKFKEKFFAENMREASTDEIVEHLSKEHNIDVLYDTEIHNISVKSINDELDDDGLTPETSGEFAVKTACENDFVKTIYDEDLKDAVRKMMKVLNAKEMEYITRHIFNEETYNSIADTAGCTNERVRQIVEGGLRKMRKCEFTQKHFACFLK
jgi:RNA polymerase sigma factor (sigma-70 family)